MKEGQDISIQSNTHISELVRWYVTGSITGKIWNRVRYQVDGHVREQVCIQVWDEVNIQAWDQVWDRVVDRVYPPIQTQTESNFLT